MDEWNYCHGAIMLGMDRAINPTRNYEDALDFIFNKLPSKNLGYFHPRMFSTSIEEGLITMTTS